MSITHDVDLDQGLSDTAGPTRSLYRTALRIDSGSTALAADQCHRMAMDLFPVDLPRTSPRQSIGVLSRQDGDILIVQSHITPSRPVCGATIMETGCWKVPDLTKPFGVRVRLAAETNTSGGPAFLPREARRRVEHAPIPPNERREWAIAKLGTVGLIFQTPPDVRSGAISFTEGKRPDIPIVDLHGTALAIDQGRLFQAVSEGVGRAKAYGCGLLDIHPASA